MSVGIALFRADASPEIGGGHVVRSLALADGLAARGWRCVFACTERTRETVPALAASGHRLLVPGGDTAEEEAASIGQALETGADWLVVDHYGRDASFERACRAWAARVLVIDELADRPHDADLLVDPTPGRSPAEWETRVPPACELLLGPAYALLRAGFAVTRTAALARREEQRGLAHVLISFGSVDAGNRTVTALEGIRASGLELEVDVVLGAAAPHLESVSERLRAMPLAATLHLDADDMPRLMAAADLAIGAGGTTAWERCCLGLPALVLVEADNQRRYAQEIAAAGAVINLGEGAAATADDIAAALMPLAAHPHRLATMSEAAATLCDGNGVARVLECMTAQTP